MAVREMKWVIMLAAGSLAAIAGPRTIAAQDKVFNLKNIPAPGTVTDMSADKVMLETPTGTRTFETNEITRITYGEEPREMAKIRDNLRDANYEAALSDLKSLDPASVNREAVRQEIIYLRAMCEARIALASGGKREEALNNLQNFFKGNAGFYRFYEGAELLGDLASAMGDYGQAVRFYTALGKAPWPDYKLRANVLEARALAAQGKFAEAQERYEAVIGNPESSADANRQKMLATVGKAVCLNQGGKTDEAQKILEDLIKNNDSKDSRLFGRAYNALGACYLRAKRPKEALIQYLHVHLMFYGEPDTHAEALHHLVKLWTEMQKSDRAIEMRAILVEQYGGSVWAKGV
jgi:tetratricopeptide (TPR) repeat protein